MAKKTTTPSLGDYLEEEISLTEEEQEEETSEEEGQEEEEQEEESPKDKKKPAGKKKEKAPDEESEEDEEEKPDPKKKPIKDKNKEKEEEAPSEEEEEESEEGSEEEEETPDATTFFEEVEKITGQPVEVDYGDVDPLTPQGIAKREQAIYETAQANIEEFIKTNHPRIYQALEYEAAGGNVSDLFKEAATRDYSIVELKEEDDALATKILEEYYQAKGFKEVRIKKLIELAQESEEGVVVEAKAALEELQKEQRERSERLVSEQKQKEGEEKKRDASLVQSVDEVLETGRLDNFKINPKEGKEFRSFVVKSIRRKGEGRYEFATELDPKSLEKQLQYLYFQFKKGDITGLIQAKEASKQAQTLKLRFKQEAEKNKKTTTKEERNQFPTLKDYEEK